MSDSTKERFYFIQNKFIWNYFYTIGDYNKYLNTIRGLIGRCNRYFERWLYLIPQDFGMIHERSFYRKFFNDSFCLRVCLCARKCYCCKK